jgi:hypothetical protein
MFRINSQRVGLQQRDDVDSARLNIIIARQKCRSANHFTAFVFHRSSSARDSALIARARQRARQNWLDVVAQRQISS